MPPAGHRPESRAHAHYKWAERYAQEGDVRRSQAHFGRALEYTRFGGDDEVLAGKSYQKRVKNDMRNIVEAGVAATVSLELNGEKLLMTFVRAADKAEITASIPDGYPFKAPVVYVDGRRAPDDWKSAADTITNMLGRYDERRSKGMVLILCHPSRVTRIDDADHGHWLARVEGDEKGKSLYDSIMEIHGPSLRSTMPVSFLTVDNQPGNNDADYKADAFSSSFAYDHKGEYDAILVPDCGGVWFDPGSEDLVGMCVRMILMLKPGGFIFFSKILDDLRLASLVTGFERAGCSVVDYRMEGLGMVLVARKIK